MDRIAFIVSILLLTTFSWARTPLTDPEIASIINEFQYPNNYKEISSKQKGGSFSSCWTYTKKIQTVYPTETEALDVDLTLYVPNRKRLDSDLIPAVMMLPPTGGKNFLDKKMAETFCDNKIAAIILENDFANVVYQADKKLLPPEDHEKSYYRAAAAIKATMALIQEDPNLDYERMGLFGVSLGGIISSFVMSTQKDLAAGYFIVAGGDVPNILAVSGQDEVSRIRQKRMKEQGFTTIEEYEAFLRTHITIDPMDIAKTMVPETLTMVISTDDKNVPFENQEALYQSFGKPEVRYSNSGHVGTVLNSMFTRSARREIKDFFSQRFEVANPRPKAFEWMKHLPQLDYLY